MIFFGITKQWERHVLFILGKFHRMTEPGLYFYIPILTRVLYRINTRIITYTVPLQKSLTKDNIPVEVDAVIFYQVKDPKACILNVDDYHKATQLGARTAIRDMVGKSQLDDLLAERDKIGQYLKSHIDEFVSQWGVTVISVEIKDVIVAKEVTVAVAERVEALVGIGPHFDHVAHHQNGTASAVIPVSRKPCKLLPVAVGIVIVIGAGSEIVVLRRPAPFPSHGILIAIRRHSHVLKAIDQQHGNDRCHKGNALSQGHSGVAIQIGQHAGDAA